MKFVNQSQNTVFLDDINRYVPYLEDLSSQDISTDEVLRSRGFQQMVLMGQFKIVECGNERIEKNLMRMQNSMSKLRNIQSETNKEDREDMATEKPDTPEVVIKGHFLEGGGYAKVNRNLALALHNRGITVRTDILGGQGDTLNDEEAQLLRSLSGKASKHAIHIDSVVPSISNVSSGKYSILYTTIESYSVPDQFVETLSLYNEVWVTSDFCKEILQKYVPNKKIWVLPDSIDTDLYKEQGDRYEFQPPLDGFTFLSVFGWSYRKGFDLLLKAFLEEFSGNEAVNLLLFSKFQYRSSRSDFIKDTVQHYINQYGGEKPPRVVRCSKNVQESEMPSIYRSADAFVLFSRGEGFGLPYCESSLCGLPVAATDCSGQTMFLKDDNSYLIKPDRIDKIRPGLMHVHYWDNQSFPQLESKQCVKDARAVLREIYENYPKAKKRNTKLSSYIKSNYSIDKITSMAQKRIEQIWREL